MTKPSKWWQLHVWFKVGCSVINTSLFIVDLQPLFHVIPTWRTPSMPLYFFGEVAKTRVFIRTERRAILFFGLKCLAELVPVLTIRHYRANNRNKIFIHEHLFSKFGDFWTNRPWYNRCMFFTTAGSIASPLVHFSKCWKDSTSCFNHNGNMACSSDNGFQSYSKYWLGTFCVQTFPCH